MSGSLMLIRALFALVLGVMVAFPAISSAGALKERMRPAGGDAALMGPALNPSYAPPQRFAADISESQAVRAALACVQGGEPLKVARQGRGFRITVLKGSQVRVVNVDGGGQCR